MGLSITRRQVYFAFKMEYFFLLMLKCVIIVKGNSFTLLSSSCVQSNKSEDTFLENTVIFY